MPIPSIPPRAAQKIVDISDVGFDVILLAGQSNCVGYGASSDVYLDVEDERIWQYCSYGVNAPLGGAQTTATFTTASNSLVVASATSIQVGAQVYAAGVPTGTSVTAVTGTTVTISKLTTAGGTSAATTFAPYAASVIKAREPLEHFRKGGSTTVGPGLALARLYVRTLKNNRRVLLVPTAWGSTGFYDNNWNPGDQMYQHAMAQVAGALLLPNSRFVGMVWVQGEQDAIRSMAATAYATAFKTMWVAMKTAIPNASKAWCVVGAMVPEWVFNNDSNVARAKKIAIHDAQTALPGDVERLWFVDGPEGAEAYNSAGDSIHYNAVAQRTIGTNMFYEGYLNAIKNVAGISPALVQNVKANGAVTIGVRISWRAQYQVSYNLRWRVVGAANWVNVSGISATSYLVPSEENQQIEVQVQAYRDSAIGEWSASVTATSTPTLLSGLLFRATPSEIVTSTGNGAYPTGATTGATYVSRWTDRSGNNRNFETVIHGSIKISTSMTTTAGSTSATVVSATGIYVGSVVYQANVPYGTTITAISGTTVTLSAAATASGAVTSEIYSPLSRNYAGAVTQNTGLGRPRLAVVDGINTVAITNEYKSLWNKAGIVGNNSYSKTWLVKHVAVNTLPNQTNVTTDDGTVAFNTGSRNYTSCYVNTASTGADSTLTWRTGDAKLNFSHNSLAINAKDTVDMSAGVWTLFTGTFDRTTGEMKLYRNGGLQSTFTNTGVLSSFSMYLGAIDLGPFRAGATGACFAEVVAHNRVLSADDALTLSDYMRAKYNVVLG